MKVCRIEKDTVFRKVGEVITASKKNIIIRKDGQKLNLS